MLNLARVNGMIVEQGERYKFRERKMALPRLWSISRSPLGLLMKQRSGGVEVINHHLARWAVDHCTGWLSPLLVGTLQTMGSGLGQAACPLPEQGLCPWSIFWKSNRWRVTEKEQTRTWEPRQTHSPPPHSPIFPRLIGRLMVENKQKGLFQMFS